MCGGNPSPERLWLGRDIALTLKVETTEEGPSVSFWPLHARALTHVNMLAHMDVLTHVNVLTHVDVPAHGYTLTALKGSKSILAYSKKGSLNLKMC